MYSLFLLLRVGISLVGRKSRVDWLLFCGLSGLGSHFSKLAIDPASMARHLTFISSEVRDLRHDPRNCSSEVSEGSNFCCCGVGVCVFRAYFDGRRVCGGCIYSGMAAKSTCRLAVLVVAVSPLSSPASVGFDSSCLGAAGGQIIGMVIIAVESRMLSMLARLVGLAMMYMLVVRIYQYSHCTNTVEASSRRHERRFSKYW